MTGKSNDNASCARKPTWKNDLLRVLSDETNLINDGFSGEITISVQWPGIKFVRIAETIK